MDINSFREFVVLADTGNYMVAADKLYLTQSTLSRHIQSFEKDLGAPVFERTTRKVTLNEYGQIMLPYARQITSIQDEYSVAIYNQIRIDHDNIRIGTIPMMVSYGITDALAEFRKENPAVTVDIHESDSSQLVPMLQSGECDFAFMREFDKSSTEFNRLPFSQDSMVAIMPKDHPLAKKEAISLGDLKDCHLLLLSKDTMMYKLCISECHTAGFEPVVAFTSHHAANILEMVRKGMGIALLTEKPILRYDLNGIALVDIRPEITTAVDLIYRKQSKLPQTSAVFLKFMKDFVAQGKQNV